MRLASPFILNCPSCNAAMLYRNFQSVNTFGARRWSDGKIEADGAPENPSLTKCRECGTVFFVHKVEVKPATPQEAEQYQYVPYPELADYVFAIQERLFSTAEEEFQLHLSLMLKFNDRVRRKKALHEGPEEEKIWEENLRWLLQLKPVSPDRILLCADIHRNLGAFDSCLQLLETVSFPPQLTWIKSGFSRECERRNTLVFELLP